MRFAIFRKSAIRELGTCRRGWLAVMVGAALGADAVGAGGFEFVVIGDTRPRFESQNFRPFEGLIGHINTLKPALVVNVGDLIFGYGLHSKEKQWDKYQQVIRAIQRPYHQLPGNHDTHSKDARRIYERRFGRGYRSFDYQGCHFVLLDNTEQERWGYLGPAQLDWLKTDLKKTRADMVFVFLHFPVWEPERITPEYYDFWAQVLHPLFRQSRVRAVFGGHFHTYGPTRDFDGIPYFITGGGGAELIPEYRKSGGQHHFVKVKVSGDTFDVRVVTERGELSDPEADVLGGLLFGARRVSRIGIKRGPQDLKAGVKFSVSIENPDLETLTGRAEWVLDASAFSVEPQQVPVQIPGESQLQQAFTLRALKDVASLQSLPRLEFNVMAGGRRHRFHREIRFLDEMRAPYRPAAPILDGQLPDWEGMPRLKLGKDPKQLAEVWACYDAAALYLAVEVPTTDPAETQELGFGDDLQIGIAKELGTMGFGADFLRLGLSCGTQEVRSRTPGRRSEGTIAGAKCVCRPQAGRTIYEIAMPLRLLKGVKAGGETRLVLDLSFPVPDAGTDSTPSRDPTVNTLAYRVRYGVDSLVPVYFIELTLDPKAE